MLTILRTYPFLIPLVVLILTEIVKMSIDVWHGGEWHAWLFQPGGMPSSHSAFVTSLLIIVARKLGIESMEFAISFVFACIVWYDAMSARRALGEQAKILNRLQKWEHLSERLGHSLRQVIGGIVFGAAVTIIGIWISN
jgi:acid phosphatase family membrane protein YuiD